MSSLPDCHWKWKRTVILASEEHGAKGHSSLWDGSLWEVSQENDHLPLVGLQLERI